MLWIVAALLLSAEQPIQRFCDDTWKAPRPVVEDLRAGRDIALTISERLPPYHFHIEADPDCGGIRQIEVRTPAKLLVQTLRVDDSEAPFIGSKFFLAEDLNFDGFRDLMCLTYWGATGNTFYSVWLFNPKSHLFEPSAELSKLGNLNADVKTREITSGGVGGMAGNIYGRSIYKWREGRLVLVSSEHQDWDPKTRCFVRTTKTLGGPRPRTRRKKVCDPDWK
jgi:hypothetical protein